MKALTALALTVAWLVGVVIAKGFWATFFALIPIVGIYDTVAYCVHRWMQ